MFNNNLKLWEMPVEGFVHFLAEGLVHWKLNPFQLSEKWDYFGIVVVYFLSYLMLIYIAKQDFSEKHYKNFKIKGILKRQLP